MLKAMRRHAATFLIATVAAMVAAGGMAIAHDADGGGHDGFAHKAALARKANKMNKIVIRRSDPVTVVKDQFKTAEVTCPSGSYATGGGAAGSVQGVDLIASWPSDGTGDFKAGHTAWTTTVFNSSSIDRTFRAYVSCLKAASLSSNYTAGSDPA